MRPIRILVILAAAALFFSCGGATSKGEADEHGHDGHAVTATLWGDSLELFMEYHPPVAGETAEFLVHLTSLPGFTAPEAGSVTVDLEGSGGSSARGASEAPVRNGIWVVEVPVVEAGEYHLHITCQLPGFSESFDAGHITAWAGEKELEASMHLGEEEHGHEGGEEQGHGEETGGIDEITFLKEQQWSTRFAVGEARLEELNSSLLVVAEVLPRQQGYAEVVTPVEGFLNVLHNQGMASPGTRVERGDGLITVCPPVGGSGSWTEKHLGYLRAKQEFERAERLLDRDAISRRDYETIRQEYMVSRASYETVLSGGSAEPVEDAENGEVHLVLKAPVGGIVSAVDVMPGQAVSAGQKVMTIVDPSRVWLRANLFERDYYRMGIPVGLEASVPGLGRRILFSGDEMKVLSSGDLFDRDSRTIPVVFEILNREMLLKIGQVVQLEILTSEAAGSIAVPEGAIVDEDYGEFVYVQTGGEAFEKRPVRTGTRSRGMVAVLEGLAEGERVVTEGAYMVKLASTTSEIGNAHVH